MNRTLILFVAAVALTSCGAVDAVAAGGTVSPNAWDLLASTPDETRLLVTTSFGGVASGCSRFEGWEVEETDDRVEITALLWNKTFPTSCTDDGAGSTVSVQLENPLGDRELVGCTSDDCRSFESEISLYSNPANLATLDDHVVISGMDGLLLFDTDGALLGFDADLRLQQPSVGGDLLIGNGESGAVAYDPVEANARWTSPDWLLATDGGDAYACSGDEEDGVISQLSAIDGVPQWLASAPCWFVVPFEDTVLVIGSDPAVDGGSELVVIDRRTGEVLVRSPFDDGIDDRVEGMSGAVRVGDKAVVFGWQSDTVVLDQQGAEIARRSERLGDIVGATDRLVVTKTRNEVQATEPVSGEQIWSISLAEFGDPEEVQSLLVDDQTLIAGRGAIARFDAATGAETWTIQASLSRALSMTAADTTVYVASPLALIALDSTTGEEVWASAIPWSGEVVSTERDAS